MRWSRTTAVAATVAATRVVVDGIVIKSVLLCQHLYYNVQMEAKASKPTFYLLKQVFRSACSSHATEVDLGIYSSQSELDKAADLFVKANPPHPDTPYNLYSWPCELDRNPHDISEDDRGAKAFLLHYH